MYTIVINMNRIMSGLCTESFMLQHIPEIDMIDETLLCPASLLYCKHRIIEL